MARRPAAPHPVLVFETPSDLASLVARVGPSAIAALGPCRVLRAHPRRGEDDGDRDGAADHRAPARLIAIVGAPDALAALDPEGRWRREARVGPNGTIEVVGEAEALVVEAEGRGGDLITATPLEAAAGDGPPPESAFFIAEHADAFATLVRAHLELGNDRIGFARLAAATPGAEAGAPGADGGDGAGPIIARIDRPSLFFLERPPEGITSLGRVGRGEVYVPFGAAHPLETLLPRPRPEEALLVLGPGQVRAVTLAALAPIEEALRVTAVGARVDRFETTGEAPPRVLVPLRLGVRAVAADAELFVLDAAELPSLERACGLLPDEELKNLLLAAVTTPAGEDRLLVRELIAGRTRRRVAMAGRPFAPQPGLARVFVPADRIIEPPLRPHLVLEALGAGGADIVIVEPAGEQLAIHAVAEGAFRPLPSLVDYVVARQAERVESVIAATVFDPGPLYDDELVIVGGGPAVEPPKAATPGAPSGQPEDAPAPRRRRRAAKVDADPAETIAAVEAPEAPAEDAPAEVAATPQQRDEDEAAVTADPVAAAGRWLALAADRSGRPADRERCFEWAAWLAAEPAPVLARWRDDHARRAGLSLTDAGAVASFLVASSTDPAPLLLKALLLAAPPPVIETRLAELRSDAVARLYRDLREAGGHLGKKSRWIAWRAVIAAAGDPVEEERQREELLTELARFGVTEREVPSFVRRRLASQYSRHRATPGGSGDDARAPTPLEPVLERAAGVLRECVGSSALRAVGLAALACARTDLGDTGAARELLAETRAHLAESVNVGSGEAGRDEVAEPLAEALAQVAAATAIVESEAAGRAVFEQALQRAASLRPQRKQVVLPKLAAAIARGFTPGAGTELFEATLALADEVTSEVYGPPIPIAPVVLQVAAPHAAAVAATDAVRRRASALIGADLPALYLAGAVEALAATAAPGAPAVGPAEGRALVRWLRDWRRSDSGDPLADVNGLDEHTILIADAAFAAAEASPVEVGDEIAGRLAARGEAQAAVLLQGSVIRTLCERGQRDEAAARLERVLPAVFELRDSYDLIRALRRLLDAIPLLGRREQGTALLGRVLEHANRMTVDPKNETYVKSDILGNGVSTASRIGASRETGRLLEAASGQLLRALQRPRRQSYLLLDALQNAVVAAESTGERDRTMALVERADAVARRYLDAVREDGEGRGRGARASRDGNPEGQAYYAVRLLAQCGATSAAVGDHERGEALLALALDGVAATGELSRMELLGSLLGQAATLPGGGRATLALRVLDQAGATVTPSSSTYAQRDLVELVRRCADDVVRGESAYAVALKRWRGTCERVIRERVLAERIVEQ